MAHYRLYRINSGGHFEEATDAECEDDDDARATARELFGESTAREVWCGIRPVELVTAPLVKGPE